MAIADHSGEQQDDPDNPYIKQVVLQNFMSHENFKLNLGPSVNVIVGENGTGKSSILTGIIVALGGRAKSTSRGDSLAELVKTGETKSTISLKIHVPPLPAVMRRKYGDEVTIKRIITLNASGDKATGAYKLYDSKGRLAERSTSTEVKHICTYFGLYPGNELAMLSQENAKEFLVNATPQAKYRKLKDALLQNVIEQDCRHVKELEEEHDVLLDRIKVLGHSAAEKEETAKKTLHRAKAHASASTQLNVIERVLAWRKVRSVQAQMASVKVELAKKDETIQGIEERLDVEARNLELTETLRKLEESGSVVEDEVSELQAQSARSNKELSDARREHAGIKDEIRTLAGQATELKHQLEEAKRAAEALTPAVIEKRRADFEHKLADADAQRSEALIQVRRQDTEIARLIEIESSKQNDLRRAEAQRDSLIQQIGVLEREKKEIQAGRSTTTRRVPENVSKLMRMVDSEAWDKKPIGPLYRYVQVKDDGADFAPALERLWLKTLDGWWVQTDRDRAKLQSLAQQCKVWRFYAIMRKDDPYDFSSALPAPSNEYLRAVDVITPSSEAVLRILVDLNHIEALVLVRDSSTAFRVTDRRNRTKARTALALVNTRKGARKFMAVATSASSTESSFVDPMTPARMNVGSEARTRQITLEIQDLRGEVVEAGHRIRRAQDSLAETQEELNHAKRAQAKAAALRRRAEDDAESVRQQVLDLETQLKSSDRGAAEIESTEIKLQDVQSQIKEGNEALKERVRDLQEAQDALDAVSQDLKSATEKSDGFKKKIRRVRSDIDRLQHTARTHGAQLDRQVRKREEIAGRLRSLEVEVEQAEETAIAFGADPFETAPTDSKDLEERKIITELRDKPERELTSALNLLKGQQHTTNTAEKEIEEALQMQDAAQREFRQIKRDADEMERLGSQIRERQSKRDINAARAWDAIKHHIQASYETTLQSRNFVGSLAIDDKREKLVTQATPGQMSDRSASTLSGGEKSFTQLALLMAVWREMHVGFIAMDEYDVYMDKVNRSLSLRLLGNVVRSKNIQCVLITPQDIDTLTLDGIHLEIHKLAPARRRQ